MPEDCSAFSIRNSIHFNPSLTSKASEKELLDVLNKKPYQKRKTTKKLRHIHSSKNVRHRESQKNDKDVKFAETDRMRRSHFLMNRPVYGSPEADCYDSSNIKNKWDK